MSQPCPIGVLISGRGSNFAAIQSAIESGKLPNAQIKVVVSNRKDAPGLSIAKRNGITAISLNRDAYTSRESFDYAVCQALKSQKVKLVVLAGYDQILGEPILSTFKDRILNIHPSLLPAYGGKGMVGLKVHQEVLNGKETESGCSVHVVTTDVDCGPVVSQARVPVRDDDTPEALALRVLEQEHQLYPKAIQKFIELNHLDQGSTHEKDTLV